MPPFLYNDFGQFYSSAFVCILFLTKHISVIQSILNIFQEYEGKSDTYTNRSYVPNDVKGSVPIRITTTDL